MNLLTTLKPLEGLVAPRHHTVSSRAAYLSHLAVLSPRVFSDGVKFSGISLLLKIHILFYRAYA